jgi:hypothetical protein
VANNKNNSKECKRYFTERIPWSTHYDWSDHFLAISQFSSESICSKKS